MKHTSTEAAAIIDAVQRWAAAQAGILAAALIGSHARNAARPDSDVDFLLLCERPGAWLSDRAWLSNFGEVASIGMEDWGMLRSLRVCYASGLEAEFGIAPPAWAALPPDPGTERVVRDGLRILHDPQELLAMLQAAVPAQQTD
jgi:uncharacterized protein